MPENSRYPAQPRGGLLHRMGEGIRNAWRGSELGHYSRGDWLGGFNQSSLGQGIAMVRGGDPIGPNNSRRFIAGRDAGPPTAADQYGNPDSPDFVGPPEAQGGFGGWWQRHFGGGRESAPASSGGGSGRSGFQGGGLGNARASDRVATGARGNMGGSSTNPLLSGNTSGGLGRLMMSTNPWRQSGVDFIERQGER